MEKDTKFHIGLLVVFVLFWIWMAIDPSYRKVWFIENVILLIFMAVLLGCYKWFKFSKVSYSLIFLFCILQTIGAHYTYAEVPFDWFTNMFDFERNHYDRIVHFSFGFLLAFPFREFMLKLTEMKSKFFSYYFPVEMAFGTGAAYEVIEWLYAVTSDPQAGHAFLGSQGDVWDAQVDMFLAGLGSIIAMAITFVIVELFGKKKNQVLQ